jgi:acyl-CoA thioester hydrolase
LNRNPDFQTAINVRFNDIDAMGHVNNAVMFTYFEEGRKALFLERLKGVKGGGFNFILAHIQCDYLLPVRLEDRPVLKIDRVRHRRQKLRSVLCIGGFGR